MKHMNRILALALALMMVLGLATTAYAATITTSGTHQYEVYQIFTGDLSGTVLSNIIWGKNGTGTENQPVDETVLTALKNVAESSDVDKLAVISQYVNFDSDAFGTVNAESKLEDVPTGYYLIKDSNVSGDDFYTLYIVEVVGDVTISPKGNKPSVDKQVLDDAADAEADSTDGWGETADHAINESFKFKLTATLPADTDFAAYKTYKIVFTDTMSAGITFEGIDSVTVGGTTIDAQDYTLSGVAAGDAGKTWTLTIDNIKEYDTDLTDGAYVEVIYGAHLNETAVIGNEDDNKNSVKLQYSNNPNVGGEDSLGETAPDTVWVFSYEMKNKKTDGENNALAGATFAIKNEQGQYYGGVKEGTVTWVESEKPVEDENIFKVTSNAEGDFTIKGLDAGTYILEEIVTPAGYNTCKDITVVISATHKELTVDTAETVITMTKDGTTATEIIVVNNAGATLPETGGIGTTLFYAIGGLLVVAAVVLLVTKKRMNAAE